jgi:hypothetical protein
MRFAQKKLYRTWIVTAVADLTYGDEDRIQYHSQLGGPALDLQTSKLRNGTPNPRSQALIASRESDVTCDIAPFEALSLRSHLSIMCLF